MYSPNFKRPKPPDDDGWRATFLLMFAIIVLLGAGSILMIARTVGVLDPAAGKAASATEEPTVDAGHQRLASLGRGFH
ncbi:hypothetical protein [Salinarimonas soli]|uniref:Uncharacterized protein n=1 Tax=Salinarimonas soli TaxID=1638099 RepID=A0A5B2VF03_9HYPH|nr:hypothetical protein [Salinarimonas soli]KAA2238143.1 hypothetical protein F0L46_06625 [Salinarimonas soli]